MLFVEKKMIKLVTTYLLLSIYSKSFLAPNTHSHIYIHTHIYTYISASAIRSLGHSAKMFGILTPLQTMHPFPVLNYQGAEIFEK